MSADREQRIRELAHHIWESEGCPPGQALRHWAMAERLYAATEAQPVAATEPAPSAGAAAALAAGLPGKPATRVRKPGKASRPTKGRTR